MKKIMFNDKYGLTQAVLEGRKTQTRRIIPRTFFTLTWDVRNNTLVCEDSDGIWHDIRTTPYAFKVGEIVAVSQRYIDILNYDDFDDPCQFAEDHPAAYKNKMFVRADLMPHQIRITNVRIERLQDISDEDCLAEGIRRWTKDCELFKYDLSDGFEMYDWQNKPRTPREAYAALIDKISGKGTYASNPYVFAYTFELLK